MLPINPLPPFSAARPLLLLGLTAGATALALWARRKLTASTATRVEKKAARPVEVPWGTELPPSLLDAQPAREVGAATPFAHPAGEDSGLGF